MTQDINFLPPQLALAVNKHLNDLGVTEHSVRWGLMRFVELVHAEGYREGYMRGGADEHAGVRFAEKVAERDRKSELVNEFVAVKP